MTELSMSETSMNETSMNETSMNETSMSELSMNETSMNETSMSETSMTELSMNELSMNELSMNEVSMNEVSMNEVSMSEVSMSELLMSDISNIPLIFNLLLIDNTVKNYQDIVDSVNSNTKVIVYSYVYTKEDLSNILMDFTTIERIGFIFSTNEDGTVHFLDYEPFFTPDMLSLIHI